MGQHALSTYNLCLNLETTVGSRQKVQDFESESLTIGVEHSQKGLVHLFGQFSLVASALRPYA